MDKLLTTLLLDLKLYKAPPARLIPLAFVYISNIQHSTQLGFGCFYVSSENILENDFAYSRKNRDSVARAGLELRDLSPIRERADQLLHLAHLHIAVDILCKCFVRNTGLEPVYDIYVEYT